MENIWNRKKSATFYKLGSLCLEIKIFHLATVSTSDIFKWEGEESEVWTAGNFTHVGLGRAVAVGRYLGENVNPLLLACSAPIGQYDALIRKTCITIHLGIFGIRRFL